ncbi:hypothetical protein ADK41_19650 [Streptomyces caelestis]|uniref:Secreted protein n=1 Tax=Streptomyces caelestis TaxID=36816 RepID=A0A0M9X823_9ACTN|nr:MULTISPECIES: hypothetical protein [Streptomyces]KOT37566.1 hypothetical protein ADK41_19650 [Streptomyces caelestis]KOV28277.1 hypothetical protein ADK58_11865 [Streptomyces sp. XY152]
MGTTKRASFRAAIVTVATLTSIAAAPMAMAAESGGVGVQALYCDSSGWTASGDPHERCTSLSNGVLYHSKRASSSGTTLRTGYDKDGGSTISAQLGYSMSGTTKYASAVSIANGQNKSKSWTVSGDKACLNSVGLLSYSGGSYQTPAAHC